MWNNVPKWSKNSMNIDFFFIGLVLGSFAVGYYLARIQVRANLGLLDDTISDLKADKTYLDDKLKQSVGEIIELNKQLSAVQSELSICLRSLDEQKEEVLVLQHRLTVEFENIANRVLESKSSKFVEQNQINLSNLLIPLGEKIKDFEAKVNDVYDRDNKERLGLKAQVEELSKLNRQMSDETRNLTRALKGDTKLQGNWGEMILESVLEKSGLTKGREYTIQMSINQDGQRYRPDVVINLPDNKFLVIDSKVSLTAYERYLSNGEKDADISLKEHVQSIKNHIRGLASKNYQSLYRLKTLDFVVMFVPIEAAYMLVIDNDLSIIEEALQKNIIIVCPSTLLATLRTIYSIWRTEKSLQNSYEIARIGGQIYDRFAGFTDSLEKIEKSMMQSFAYYKEASTRLSGSQGVMRSVNKLRELGVKTTKTISDEYL